MFADRADAGRRLADRLRERGIEVAVEAPPQFGAIRRYYREFGQVSDEEALGYLNR